MDELAPYIATSVIIEELADKLSEPYAKKDTKYSFF